MSDEVDRYPRCRAALEQLLSTSSSLSMASVPGGFRVGPGVLRPPPALARPLSPSATMATTTPPSGPAPQTGELLGELVDMVLVGADDAGSGRPEVHLQFKSDVIGGLHLRLVRNDDSLQARFVVNDAATRRAVADHVDALVAHLRARGFAVSEATLEVG
jgi:hypothetical protein